MIEEEVELERE